MFDSILDILLPFLQLAFGIGLLWKGSFSLIKYSLKIGKQLNLSELFIGMTLLAWATSLPEIFVLINSYGYDDVMFCLVIIIAPIIIASIVSRYLGEQFVRGVMAPIIITVPLSIISYFNEAANSCFCPFWCTCPPPPSYYHLPRLSAFIGAIIFLIYSISLQISGRKVRGFGIFTGLLISTLVFLFATLVGYWGFD